MKIYLLVFAVLNVIGYVWIFNFYDSEDKIHQTITICFLAINMQILILPFMLLGLLRSKGG